MLHDLPLGVRVGDVLIRHNIDHLLIKGFTFVKLTLTYRTTFVKQWFAVEELCFVVDYDQQGKLCKTFPKRA